MDNPTPIEEAIIREMLRLFRGDSRRIMQQKDDGTYCPLHLGPLCFRDLLLHLRGVITVSLYLLDENERCATTCFDIDILKRDIPGEARELDLRKRQELLPKVRGIVQYIQSLCGAPEDAFLLEDTGGRGYHLWVFFEQPQPADSVVAFCRAVKRGTGLADLEIFPQTPRHGPSGFSKSNVRLPLGFHRKYPGRRSTLLTLAGAEECPLTDCAARLSRVTFFPIEALEIPHGVATEAIEKPSREVAAMRQPVAECVEEDSARVRSGHGDRPGSVPVLCPAIARLASKAQREGHLSHRERVVLALVLKDREGGREVIHDILKNCRDYSFETTEYHIGSLAGHRPISCRRLQGSDYAVCEGWCCAEVESLSESGGSPTPLSYASARLHREKGERVVSSEVLLNRIASMDNLSRAWKEARAQARERDLFEDVLAYAAFEEQLEANLHVLRMELLSGNWRHQPLRVVNVPKTKDDPSSTRPMCWATPWDAVVELAVLNVIGPPIDAGFHKNSLGNRLAGEPRSDTQIFEDWRGQNRYREVRREGFSRHSEGHHYVLTDVVRYYEFIRHDRLMAALRRHISDQRTLDLVQQFMEAPWWLDGHELPRADRKHGEAVGLPQGPALSAFLANVYLDALDRWLERRCVDFVRYVDDLALLFASREDADAALSDLKAYLGAQLGLQLSEDKTKTQGPFPVAQVEPLHDWLRGARYELTRYARRAGSLSAAEKDELRAALAAVAGADITSQEDFDRFVRYLGFFVANTDRLDQPEAQTGVHALALYVLRNERPRHNATRIALKALVKACSEFGDQAWKALEDLFASRDDPYIRVVFLQETRRYVEENGPELTLHPDLAAKVAELINHQSQTVAAAAMACLASVPLTSADVVESLKARLHGGDGWLRPYAAFALSRLGGNLLTPTSVARVLPDNGDEAAVFLHAIRSVRNRAIVEGIAGNLSAKPLRCHTVPPLMLASLVTVSSVGLGACAEVEGFVNSSSFHDVCYNVASAYVRAAATTPALNLDLKAAIEASRLAGLGPLADQLYALARCSRLISEMPRTVETQAPVTTGSEPVPGLPTLRGLALGDVLASSTPLGMWLHAATDLATGQSAFHEIIADTRLQPCEWPLSTLREALHVLRESNRLVLDRAEEGNAHETRYLMTACRQDHSWHSVAHLVCSDKLIDIHRKAELVHTAARLLVEAQEELTRQGLPQKLVPVPTCHTLVISDGQEVRFRNVLATYAGGRHYIGLGAEGNWLELPSEEWPVYALGLFLYEVVTGKCAVSSVKEGIRKIRLAEAVIRETGDPLLAGIIGKATSDHPDKRYANIELFLQDVDEWCELEAAIGARGEFPESQFLRRLWWIQLGLERRAYLSLQRGHSLLAAVPQLAEYVLGELAASDELRAFWLDRRLAVVEVDRSTANMHVATLYILKVADLLRRRWRTECTDSVRANRRFTCPDWLTLGAAWCEIESARRVLFALSNGSLRQACDEFLVHATDALHNGRHVTLTRSRGNEADPNEDGGLEADLNRELSTILNVLACRTKHESIQEAQPGETWSERLLLMALLLLVGSGCLAFGQAGERKERIGRRSSTRAAVAAEEVARALMELRKHERILAEPACGWETVAAQASRLATSLCRAVHSIPGVTTRRGALPRAAFGGLCSERLSRLDLGPGLHYRKAVLASGACRLPFPALSAPHGSRECTYSATLLRHETGETYVAALSLPPITGRLASGKVFPELREKGLPERCRTIWRAIRAYCVAGLRACFGPHLFTWSAVAIALLVLRAELLRCGVGADSMLLTVLVELFPSSTVIPYLHACRRRWKQAFADYVPGRPDDGPTARQCRDCQEHGANIAQ